MTATEVDRCACLFYALMPSHMAAQSTCTTWVPLNFGQIRMAETQDHAVGKDDQGRSIRGAFFGQSGFAKHAIMHKTSVRPFVPASELS